MKKLGKSVLRLFAKPPVNAHKAIVYPHLELDYVPKLPVPTIEETFERYQRCVEPLVSSEEFEAHQDVIEHFIAEEADVLQTDLLQLAEETSTSYLEGFWDYMYMTYGYPHPTNINPYFVVRPFTDDGFQASLSALCGSAAFHKSIEDGTIPLEEESKDIPLCMSQYRNLFSVAREPCASGTDKLWKYTDSTHAVIVRNYQFYAIELLDEDGNLLPDDVVAVNLREIYEDAENTDAEAIGALTTQWRAPWGEQRAALISESEVNKAAFDKLDRGLFVLSMFDGDAPTLEDFSRILCHSDGRNCWYDKFQIYSTNDAWVGFNMEHSGFDGHTILTLGTAIADHTPRTEGKGEGGWERIEFEKTDLTAEYVETATSEFDVVMDTIETCLCEFMEYGKGFIKSVKCSPDAYVQMCYQLAYWKCHQEMGSTYESCLTKKWFHGRTSTIRSTSPESKAMCEAFYAQENATDAEKIEAFRTAVSNQVVRSIEAKNGKDVDRHLFALNYLARIRQMKFPGYEIPQLFSDPVYQAMKYDNMSTSNCGSDDIILFGFGPVVPTGYGMGYVINEDRLCVNVTSFVGNAPMFREALIEVFREVRELFERNPDAIE